MHYLQRFNELDMSYHLSIKIERLFKSSRHDTTHCCKKNMYFLCLAIILLFLVKFEFED